MSFGRRSFVVSFIHSHIVICCILFFTVSVASYSAYLLGFFSTLLLYLPIAIFCVPALAALDALDLWNRSHWSRTRKSRFCLTTSWCLFLVFSPRYLSSGPSSYLHPHTLLPSIPPNETYYIAANLYNSARVLPTWTRELKLLIDHLGPQNVFVSVYESNSRDQTKPMLRVFEQELSKTGVRNNIRLEDADGRDPHWSLNGHERIPYLAAVRNKALEPLQRINGKEGRRFDKVIFFNDVFFDWSSIIRLLATQNGEYDLACAFDFDGVGLYDIWVTRDSCGWPTKAIWPYFSSDAIAITNLRKDNPIEVASCWNGVAAFDAQWFLAGTNKSVSTPSQSYISQFTPTLPLVFRNNPACAASECFLVSFDMHLLSAPKRPRIYMNPQVNVAYTALNYLFHARLTHLTLVRPWRVVWEDWIAHRWFGWVSDWFWMEMDRCSSGRAWDAVVKGAGCADRAV